MRRLALGLVLVACGEPPTTTPGKTSAKVPIPRPAPDVRLRPIDAAPPPPRVDRPKPRLAPIVGGPDFSYVFEQVAPSVVGVAAGARPTGRFVPQQTGTGFVWDAHGHIVTNDHLIRAGAEVRVRTRDANVLAARVIGRDDQTDIAVLQVDEPSLKQAPLGTLVGLRPGHWVAAIGNPYGMSHSITVGVVSALGRRNLPPGAPRYAEFIQTDLNINPGNSGGPLVSASGHVVGLNAAIHGQGQGLAFAIPINMLRTVVPQLIAEGHFIRGFAGLYVKPMSLPAARRAGLDRARGAKVIGVVQGGPATQAGIVPGDVIVRFGEHPVDDSSALPWMIAATPPGTVVGIEVIRERQPVGLSLLMAEAD